MATANATANTVMNVRRCRTRNSSSSCGSDKAPDGIRAVGVRMGLLRHPEGGEHRQQQDLQVERERPVADVVVVQLDAVGQRGLAAQAVDLGPAGDAGLDAVAVGVAASSAPKASTNSGRSGRGPTRLISPRSTLISWGSSSSEVRRRKRPTACAGRGPRRRRARSPAAARTPRRRAGSRIERNLRGRRSGRRGRRGAGGTARARRASLTASATRPAAGEQRAAGAQRATAVERVLDARTASPSGRAGGTPSSGRPPTGRSATRSFIDSNRRGTSETSRPSSSQRSGRAGAAIWSGSLGEGEHDVLGAGARGDLAEIGGRAEDRQQDGGADRGRRAGSLVEEADRAAARTRG